jgi:hypothetical protein
MSVFEVLEDPRNLRPRDLTPQGFICMKYLILEYHRTSYSSASACASACWNSDNTAGLCCVPGVCVYLCRCQ